MLAVLYDGGAYRGRAPLPFRAYEALDRRLFRLPGDHARPTDASDLFANCPQVLARPARRGDRWSLAPTDVKQIEAAEPDLILKLGFPPLDDALTGIARLGLWSFDHLEAEAGGRPAHFWEVARGCPVTETLLRARTPDGSRVLERSFAATDPASPHRNANAVSWKASQFIARALARAGADPPDVGPGLAAPELETPARPPGPFELARFAGATGLRVLRERRRRRREDYLWFIAARPETGTWLEGALDGFEPLTPPPGRFQADPFLVADGSRTWLFAEEADQQARHGWIRCSEMRPDGSLGESRIVLERDYHLSYPFVFRHGESWYMLPETRENRTIELWRATHFPWEWTLERVLFEDVAAVDSTLLERDGRWWLFTAMSPSGGSLMDELFLFSSDSLEGEWTPHPCNPIVSDVRRARPAGRLFYERGRLHRPAQDCSGEYGSGIWIHRVDALDRERYRETPVRRIDPSWWPGALCTHTIDRAGGIEVIDARAWFARGARPAR